MTHCRSKAVPDDLVHECMPVSNYNPFWVKEVHACSTVSLASGRHQQGSLIEFVWRTVQDESIMRKKYFNQMEDMKGKIRVYARVRPMLGFEAERGQKARRPFQFSSLSHVQQNGKRVPN